jgi:hypothetical protein
MKQSNHSSKDECSVSPTMPPKPPRRNIKEKKKRGSMSCPRKHVRSLFQKRTSNKLAKLVQGRRGKNEVGAFGTVSVGPFELNLVNAREDIALLEFIFMQRPLTKQESRLVVIQSVISFFLKKYFQCFLKILFDICGLVIEILF